ncbi:MAG: hypothetical protein KDC66_00785 [Phaeodactylibacter sp.]|nr:hypothetical protein [Phaeodactylibacter sp.]MCB9274696.1 hypothetical protein [Lewinellaceae bacterium]
MISITAGTTAMPYLSAKTMGEGNTLFYIIATIIIAHFVVGFIFLIRKLSGPVKEEEKQGEG